IFFSFYSSGHHRDLHSFPTRRSSDLGSLCTLAPAPQPGGWRGSLRRLPASVPQPAFGRIPTPPVHVRYARQQAAAPPRPCEDPRSEEHTSELQSPCNLVCRLLLEKKK